MIARDVVIPAGGTIDTEFARRIGSPHRALAPFGPKQTPALQVVVDALRESGRVRHILCAAPEEVRASVSHVDTWLTADVRGPANILRLLALLPDPDGTAFVCASDLPLALPGDIASFADRCESIFDITVGLIEAESYKAAFPDGPPSQFTPLRDAGEVTLSGLFGIRPAVLLRNSARLTQVFEGRKSQARMASLLGPRLLWQWATRSLELGAITHRAETLMRCRVQTLKGNIAPALACDMDSADDYTYACQIYTARLVP